MNADGSGQVNLTKNPADNFVHFTWSPDGTRIAFACCEVLREEIYLINADGSGPLNLTNNPDRDLTPVWRPK
jgi:TolB protein